MGIILKKKDENAINTENKPDLYKKEEYNHKEGNTPCSIKNNINEQVGEVANNFKSSEAIGQLNIGIGHSYKDGSHLKKEVFEIKENTTGLEPMPKEHFQLLTEMPWNMFRTMIDNFKEKQNEECLSDIHFFVLQNNLSEKFQRAMLELIEYLKNDSTYLSLCIIFSDISHYNNKVSVLLMENNILKYLKFDQPITFNLIFNLCDQNLESWKIFKKFYLENNLNQTFEIENQPLIKELEIQHANS